jgi:hypothetical protein
MAGGRPLLHAPPLGLRPLTTGSAAPGRIMDTSIVQNVAAPLDGAEDAGSQRGMWINYSLVGLLKFI